MRLPRIMMAPMAGITDAPYRKICRAMGLELAYTEMVSSRGLIYENERTEDYIINPDEPPSLGVQLFGNDPEVMASATKRLGEIGRYDFLDLNMGCPARKIMTNRDGCQLMRTPLLAGEIIAAMRRVTQKPLSAKMRLGLTRSSVNVLEVAKRVEAAGADFIIVHGRTADQMYTGRADWEMIAQVKEAMTIPVIGNGDIFSVRDYIDRQAYGVDGFMLARGIQGNPWLIRDILLYEETGEIAPPPTLRERVEVARRHLDEIISIKGPGAIPEFRKHAGWYFKGIPGSAKFRAALSNLNSAAEFRELTEPWLDIQG
ncbi:MAG TPA: tRNA dihydrouridine synthase DusB [Tissierellia bacterium]|nr:tRNA dihydrouridine synthase DusB [Tissierellia bacterium]